MRPALYVLLGILLVPTVGLVGNIVTDGKLESTVTGKPPLQVASSVLVANLNADMVDGKDAVDFAAVINTYTKAEVDALVAAAVAADSRRWFYMSESSADGADADIACASGFHMASIYEILDVSNLRYDTGRGYTLPDSGSGPPQYSYGWVRTGDIAQVAVAAGWANCNVWTSASAADYGTVVGLDYYWDDSATVRSPWDADLLDCSVEARVWCVED